MEPWHLFVQAVYRWGLPGELSQFAVARAHPRRGEEVIVSSAQAIASGAIEIT